VVFGNVRAVCVVEVPFFVVVANEVAVVEVRVEVFVVEVSMVEVDVAGFTLMVIVFGD
jgi:hypothetical protein